MKRLYNLIVVLVLCIKTLSGQEFDLTFTNSESGTQTHVARNSVTLGPDYTYTPSGGSLTIEIQNPIMTGPVTYTSPIDPEARTLNTTSYLVGATNGSFNVNPMGGASYSIPLEMLPGVNGLSPGLSLVYSSNSGPGTAGYGWQLAGLSAISRGPKTYYHDGTARGVELDTTDRFYLDGQRLVTTNTYAYGHTSALYQTENDIFTRVTPNGTAGNGPAWFKAETKSGLVYEYGNTVASKQMINGYSQVVNWNVSKISDLYGNQLNFAYFMDRYSVYPYEITYGPNTITFYYKERADKNSSYLKGTKIEQWLILDKITVKYNTTIVKTYEFKYNYQGSSYNYFSLLNEVIEYGIGTNRVNSTAITYQIPDNVSFTEAISNNTEAYISHDSRLFSGDFNGDGKADIFCLPSSGGWRYYRSNGDNTFTLSATGDFSITEALIQNVVAIDLNGDNKDDLLFNTTFMANNYCYYAMSDGTTFGSDIFINETSGGFYAYKRNKSSAGDLNGDGLNDFVIIKTSGEIYLYSYLYNNGQLYPMALRTTLNFGTSISTSDRIFISDFNGDGMAEIWKVNDTGIKIYAVRGSSLIELFTNTIPEKDHLFKIGDFNGDGKTDLFIYGFETNDWTNWQIKLSTGNGFETYSIPQKKANLKNDVLREGDFNGDGCTDLMITANSDDGWTGHYYYISKDKGTEFYSHYYSNYLFASHHYYLDDYNGDGRDDYLCTDGVSPWFTGYLIYTAPGKTHILMEKAGNGLGFLTKLTYTKLSQATSSVYQRGTGAVFPVSDYQGSLSVISSVQFDNGRGTMNTQNYYFEGIKVHRQGKGFLGYTKTRATDVTAGIETESNSGYNTTYFYPQLISSSRKVIGQPNPYETITNTWSQKVLSATKKRIFPYVQSTTQTNSLTGHSVTLTTDYDNYGNPTPITKSYNNGVTETTTHTYNNTVSLTQWLLGRPTATTIQYTNSGNTITRLGTRSFESTNNHLLTEIWHSGSRVGIKNEFEYNNTNGTLKKQTATDIYTSVSKSAQYTYETNGIRVLTITDPMAHTTTNSYDSYGRLSTQQDYLITNTIAYLYDNMHRQASVSKNDGSGATTLYTWQDPASTPLLARYSVQTTGNDGSQSKVWYDKLGREIRSDVKGFDGTMVYKNTEYNTKGQVYRVSDPHLPSETTYWNSSTYDDYGRKTGLTTPSGRNSTWQYTSNIVTETTAGKPFIKTFASDGTLSSAADNGGTINYTYYPDGKVKTITAPGGIVTQMEYDIAGNQKKLIDPSAGTINYTYNGFGELLSQTNGRTQNTTYTYHSDGRPLQKVTPEGTTGYAYNTDEQLTGITSPGSVSRTYGYDPKGRISSISETIPGSSPAFLTTFTYDNWGRLSTTTHPSLITETNNYNSNGYLSSVSAGGSTRWTTLTMNAWGQVTSGRYGSSLIAAFGYNIYGNPTSSVTGSLQSYQYYFNDVTGNLNWRMNALPGGGIREDFEYDNLYRLDRVYRGSTTLLDMAYESNKGGITTKTDVGTLQYTLSGKPYQLSGINCTTGLITSSMNNTITYTSFESINTITQGNYNATFNYNADKERAKMVINQSGSPILTRWYPGSSYIKETAGAVTKEYTFIGGDAYTAPVVAIKQSGTTTYYNLLRDYLGSITHVVNASNNSLVAEYSYDAWGRMRNNATWVCYAPGSEPALFIAGRGYTGHEHLPWFNLINMNGRVYDPLAGQFLSPDNYIQAPGFTQSYNRYAYCLNNPLKYTDPSGEKWGWWLLGEILSGGMVSITTVGSYSAAALTAANIQVFSSIADFTYSSTKTTYNIFADIFNSGAHPHGDDSWIFKDLANCIKIDLGFPYSTIAAFDFDKSATGMEWPMQVFNNFGGGEYIQSNIGNSFAHRQNIKGNIDKIGYYKGRTTVRVNEGSFNGYSGVSHGHYIFGEGMALNPDDTEYDLNLFAHEFGHTYQSRVTGPLYYFKNGIPSGIFDSDRTEYDANYRGKENLGPGLIGPYEDKIPMHTDWWEFLIGPLTLFN
jgi:RHS repeat-associated protein